jgi:hypothetical protein
VLAGFKRRGKNSDLDGRINVESPARGDSRKTRATSFRGIGDVVPFDNSRVRLIRDIGPSCNVRLFRHRRRTDSGNPDHRRRSRACDEARPVQHTTCWRYACWIISAIPGECRMHLRTTYAWNVQALLDFELGSRESVCIEGFCAWLISVAWSERVCSGNMIRFIWQLQPMIIRYLI